MTEKEAIERLKGGHGRVVCALCDKVLASCRCMNCNQRTIYCVCNDCEEKEKQDEG